MPITKPYIKLYDSTGVVLQYTFNLVQSINIPQSPRRTVEITGQRGKGSLIIDGGTDVFDIEIRGLFMIEDADEGYEDLTEDIDAMESAVQTVTPYILRMDKDASTYYEYHVKRIEAISYPESLRRNSQEYICRLRANCW